MDIGENATLSYGHIFKEFVELLVIANSKLNVAGNNSSFLVVGSCVSGKLKNLSSEVFQNGSEVDWCSGANSGGVLSILQVPLQTRNWEG